MVWRRMKAAGAVSLQNGVWVLPRAKVKGFFVLAFSLKGYMHLQAGH